MENATKALLIAGGLFLAVLIVSLLVVFYNDISAFYQQKSELTVIEQTQEFNAKFENYHRDNIRGNELISLMNRIIDYNISQSYQDGTNYKRIKVTIKLVPDGKKEDDILKQFKYDDENFKNSNLTAKITNTKGTDVWKSDKSLIAITDTPSQLCERANNYGINNLTDNKLQQLSSEIANIIVDEDNTTSSSIAYSRFKRAQLLKDVLGINIGADTTCDVVIDKITGKTKKGQVIMNNIKEIASEYYQYMQFKRACFNCTEVIYDTETNRVEEMNFELQTKVENGKTVVVFD